MLWRAARLTSVSGDPPPAFVGIWRLYRRSVVSGPLTSAKNLSLNQFMSRRTSTRVPTSRGSRRSSPSSPPSVLVGVLGDDRRPRNRGTAFLHHHRSRAGGIEDEKFLAAFPHALLDRARGEAVFAERQAYETRVRAERVVEQCQHAALRI